MENLKESKFYPFFEDFDIVLTEDNIAVFLRVIEFMRANPKHFDMSDWVKHEGCGTAMCIAGSAIYVGCDLEFDIQQEVAHEILDSIEEIRMTTSDLLLDGSWEAADECPLFYMTEWDKDLIQMYWENRVEAGVAAIERFIACSNLYARRNRSN